MKAAPLHVPLIPFSSPFPNACKCTEEEELKGGGALSSHGGTGSGFSCPRGRIRIIQMPPPASAYTSQC